MHGYDSQLDPKHQHWPYVTSLPPYWIENTDPRRISLVMRRDGVLIVLEMISPTKPPVFLALFPGRAEGAPERSIVLEKSGSLEEAVVEVEERWPPSSWLWEDQGEIDFGPGSGSPREYPFRTTDEREGAFVFRKGDRQRFSLQTPCASWMKMRVAGLRVRISGMARVELSDFKIGGSPNLFSAEDGIVCLGTPEDGVTIVQDVFDLRHYPILISPNQAFLNVSCKAEDVAHVQVSLLYQLIQDDVFGAGLPGISNGSVSGSAFPGAPIPYPGGPT